MKMTPRNFPLKSSVLFKDFTETEYKSYNELTDLQKEYSIIGVEYKKFYDRTIKIYAIASPEKMKEWNLNEIKH